MSNGERDGEIAYARIPTWDGAEGTWRRYLVEVGWWLEGEKVEDAKYSIAARMVQRLTGTARMRASELDPRELRHDPGLL